MPRRHGRLIIINVASYILWCGMLCLSVQCKVFIKVKGEASFYWLSVGGRKLSPWGNQMSKTQNSAMAAQPADASGADVGHYFDQAVFDLHYKLQIMRARAMLLQAEQRKLFEVDEQGNVLIKDQ